jgi:hypothetical protein
MLLGPADLLDGPVRDREIDLTRRRAGLGGRQTEAPEQGLGHAVVSLILTEGGSAPWGKTGFPPIPRNETHPFERGEMAERRGRADLEESRRGFQGNPALWCLAGPDDLKRIDLAAGQPL